MYIEEFIECEWVELLVRISTSEYLRGERAAMAEQLYCQMLGWA